MGKLQLNDFIYILVDALLSSEHFIYKLISDSDKINDQTKFEFIAKLPAYRLTNLFISVNSMISTNQKEKFKITNEKIKNLINNAIDKVLSTAKSNNISENFDLYTSHLQTVSTDYLKKYDLYFALLQYFQQDVSQKYRNKDEEFEIFEMCKVVCQLDKKAVQDALNSLGWI